ncbi:signal transduction histidine kinase, LytS [Kribbella flavida DSM 17836]|uniref:Signal transduction histidine kinase, LytS n=1 Tax=Kribbella flavida (strain DSM 17836 / JCM 10339 / NBRC 14399) TaxID=479435 RepID=D2PNH5_KRIFD|nr:histidine kinase [Kribbella flavida]ADB30827.1 signal transduction histidine kinase, LytS [Kribbella flavida DSM 17836]
MAMLAVDAPITRRRAAGWAVLATLAWSGDAIVTALQYRTMVSQEGQPMPGWAEVLPTNVASSLLWVPFTVMILWLAFRWPITGARRNLLVHLAGFAVVVVGRAVAVVLLNGLVGWYPVTVPRWPELLMASLVNNLILFVLVTGFAHAVFYQQAARDAQARFTAARLDALTSQLQPHFLFNALNTIAAHVHHRPDVAEAMIVDLSALLRSSISRDSSALVPLDDELAIGSAYLKIEEHRFEDRLRVEVAVDPAARDAGVPPFLLQPLLENAVQHGLAPRAGRSTLRIRAVRTGDEVVIEVADDGAGLGAGGPDAGPTTAGGRSAARAAEGIGLANVRARLTETFGPAATLTLTANEPSGTVATIRVPYRPAVPADAAVRP